MRVTPELLRTFPCLRPLPNATLTRLANYCAFRRLARRAVVLNAGVRDEHLCFLFEGHLQGIDFTIDGREVGLYFIEPGDFCGELIMFDDGPQPEYVIARTPASVVLVPVDILREVVAEHAHVLGALAERLATRVRQMTRQRSLLGLPNVAQRVCCQLWMLTPGGKGDRDDDNERRDGHGADAPWQILNPPTHMELAIMLNLSREAVSRVFQTLQSRRIVSRDGPGCLLINDPETLQAYAEGEQKF